MVKPLRIGCVKYLNALPLIYGWAGEIDFDHPSALCRKLERGQLDVALVSSLEYLRRPIYRIVDGISIAARGAVYSVIVASRQDLSVVREIEIDPASETSIALLRCLLAQRGLNPRFLEGTASTTPWKLQDLVGACPSTTRLLIGDKAIRFRQQNPDHPVWDLGEAWANVVRLPFVFAVWLIRPEIENANEIADKLRACHDRNLARIDEIARSQTQVSPEFCRKYYHEHLVFDLGEPEKAGLREFHRRCLLNRIDVASEMPFNLV